ncbi:MAG: hypothetical protein GX601_08140 [Anaerolineales bacterium]|nr:hypothetical protein [Anaerolineales bacterium]
MESLSLTNTPWVMLVGVAVFLLLVWALVRTVLRRARACLVVALVIVLTLGATFAAAIYLGVFE